MLRTRDLGSLEDNPRLLDCSTALQKRRCRTERVPHRSGLHESASEITRAFHDVREKECRYHETSWSSGIGFLRRKPGKRERIAEYSSSMGANLSMANREMSMSFATVASTLE